MHQAPCASCSILYYPGLDSCPFYVIPIIQFLIITFFIYLLYICIIISNVLTVPTSALSSTISTSFPSPSFPAAATAVCCSVTECCLGSCLIRSVRGVPCLSSGLVNDSRDLECCWYNHGSLRSINDHNVVIMHELIGNKTELLKITTCVQLLFRIYKIIKLWKTLPHSLTCIRSVACYTTDVLPRSLSACPGLITVLNESRAVVRSRRSQ